MQVDFSMPQRLGAEYVDASDQRRAPVMLHRAILGSLERFIGMLIEHHAGAMPAWLAPEHAVVCCISEHSAGYADEVVVTLKKQGFRASADLRGEKITRKIREHSMQKVPYILVVGEKEREAGTVAVRQRGGADVGVMALADFTQRLRQEIDTRR
jgi:threonyl-tRNA synthetase